jgi:hypothetical protein
MLTYRPLKNYGGITLCGDYLSLRRLYDVICNVNEKSSLIRDKEGLLLDLAYDVRHAYEQQREIIKPPESIPEQGTQLGVAVLWPTILVQCSQLRQSLAFMDHNKEHQAVAYELEFLLERAIEQELGGRASLVQAEWERLESRHPFLEENVATRIAQFAAWTKVQRHRGLAGILASLNPMYKSFYPMWVANGVQHLVPPDAFEVWKNREFPDAKC